jgi:O-antigen ligase
LHLPLIYLIPKIFTREDVIRMGKYTLWISVPMAILVVVQFISPTSSWINMSVGGGEGNMMAGGHVRPPGTFSFTTGMVSFSGLSSCFIFWTLTETKTYSRLLTILGLLALVISLSVSGSRSAVIEVAVSFVAMLWVWSHQGKLMANVIILLPAVLLAFFLLSYFSFVGSGIEVLSDRFSEGGAAGIFGRVLSGFFAPLQYIDTVPLLGYGLGVGTSAGAVLRTGNRDFLLAEGEWSRVVLESGLILGFSYLFLRVAIVVQLLNRAAKAISENNSLAPILCVLGAVHILVDQFGQTTALGFCVIIAGLGFAALNQPIALPVVVAPASWTPGMITPRNDAMPVFAKAISGVPLPRGRSNYSRRLHGPQSPPRT